MAHAPQVSLVSSKVSSSRAEPSLLPARLASLGQAVTELTRRQSGGPSQVHLHGFVCCGAVAGMELSQQSPGRGLEVCTLTFLVPHVNSIGGIEQPGQLLGADVFKVFLPVLPGDGVEGLRGQGSNSSASVVFLQAADGAPDSGEQLGALVAPNLTIVVVHKVTYAQRQEVMVALKG